MHEAIMHGLKETVCESKGLPGRFFTSTEVLDAEKKYFFRNSWICIGLVHDAPKVGNVYPVTIMQQALLIVRNRASQIRVFHNVCSHRGAQLVEKPGKCVNIVCPYHCWTYDLHGELKKTPHVGGEGIHHCKDIDKSTLGLKEVRSGIWANLIFVNLSGAAEDFGDFIGPLSDRWRRIDFSLLKHVTDLGQRPEFHANWKLVVENFVESYHLPWVHQSMNAFNPMGAHYQILGADRYIGQGVKGHNPSAQYAGKFKAFPSLGPGESGTGESMYLPSNLLIICMADFFFINIVMPVSPTLTQERIEMFLIGDCASDPALQPDRQQLMEMLVQVNNEDIAICESAQRGRASEAFEGGVFAPVQETTTLQFQRLVAARILLANGIAANTLPSFSQQDIHHPG
jgi:choline monooxygenase